jgi:uncharacterized protein YjiS (DUF1127 family)
VIDKAGTATGFGDPAMPLGIPGQFTAQLSTPSRRAGLTRRCRQAAARWRAALAEWRARYRDRRYLASLSGHELERQAKDVGVTRATLLDAVSRRPRRLHERSA